MHEQRLGFCKTEREGVYFLYSTECSGTARSSAYVDNSGVTSKICRKATANQAKVRAKVEFCKADKRRSIPPYVTERFDAARLEICRNFA